MTTRFRLAALLDAAGMSQAELAERAKLSTRTINRMCLNTAGQVSLKTLDKIATVLGVEPGELIEREVPVKLRRAR